MSNNNEILLFDPKTNDETKATILNRHELGFRTSEGIMRATARIEDRDVSTPLIIKTINNLARNKEEEKMDPADVWLKKREMVSNAGIPVVPEAWKISPKQIAMTDLEANGSVVYGKINIPSERITNKLDYLLPGIISARVRDVAQEYATLADKSKILLPIDDPLALVIKPDSQWSLIALDVGLTEKIEDVRLIVHADHLVNWNKQAVTNIVRLIEGLQINQRQLHMTYV